MSARNGAVSGIPVDRLYKRRSDSIQAEEVALTTSEPVAVTRQRFGATAVAWSKDDPFGAEYAEISLADGSLSAEGIAIGSEPLPYRLDYALRTGPDFITAEVEVFSRGDGWERSLRLVRSLQGRWTAETASIGEAPVRPPGGETEQFDDALDPDLGLSPLFNSMPVLRHRLHDGGAADDFMMVWISVPDLAIHRSPQRYTHLQKLADGNALVRFEAVGEGEDFVADIVFDTNGIVLDYPGIATRIR
jgi:hypothetical protein